MALLGAEANQLDRFGKELKCAICLGLFKQASSLSCNHAFCTSCIMQSIKHNSVCPICKVPTSRREVRAAPQMDNLVSIFISMGNAAGIDIMASQADSASQPRGLKRRSCSKKNALLNITNLGKKSRPKTRHRSNSPESGFKGPIPPKKRVQVPQPSSFAEEFELGKDVMECQSQLISPLCSHDAVNINNSTSASDSPNPRSRRAFKRKAKLSNACKPACGPHQFGEDDKVCNEPDSSNVDLSAETVGKDSAKSIKTKVTKLASNVTEEVIQDTNCTPPRDGTSRWKLDPFFWLRDEDSQGTDAIQVTQQTPITPFVQPDFSDLKDSDESDQEIVKVNSMHAANSYDSDDFDWTQQPCSPELKCSPTKNIVVDMPLEDTYGSKNKHVMVDIKSTPEASLCRVTASQKHWQQEIIMPSDLRSPNTPIEADHVDTSGKRKRKCKVSEGYAIKQFDTTPNESLHPKIASRTTSSGKKRKISKKEVVCITKNKKPSVMAAWRETEDSNSNETSSEKGKTDSKTVAFHDSEGGKEFELRECTTQKIFSTDSKKHIYITGKDCVFCGNSEDSKVTGPMVHYSYEGIPVTDPTVDAKLIHAHSHCAEWAPDVYFVKKVAKNLAAEAARGMKIKCSMCGRKGAALGCCLSRCKRSYHYPCARAIACKWKNDDFVMLCPEHVNEEFPTRKTPMKTEKRSPKNRSPLSVQDVNGSVDVKPAKWQNGTMPKLCLCGSALDSKGKEQLAEFAKVTGATITKAWNSSITHVIAGTDEHGAARRTLKFLMGILEGKWIVRTDWLSTCTEAGKLVNEEAFEVQMDIHGVADGPKHGRLLAENKVTKLFNGIEFYFMPDFLPDYKGDLQGLVVAGGGLVLHRKPVVSVDAASKITIVIYNSVVPNNISNKTEITEILNRRQLEARTLAGPAGAYVVSHNWILDSIASSKLKPFK